MSHGSVTTPDLIGLVSRQFTPDVIHSTALQLEEGDEPTRSALSASIPSVLTALSDVAGSNGGAARLARVIDDSRRGGGAPGVNFGSHAGRERGAALFDREAGDRAGPIADAVARSSGVRPESAHELLGGATGAAMLALAGGGEGRLEPDALKTMLAEQRGEFVRRLPTPVASLFAPGRPAELAGPAELAARRPAPLETTAEHAEHTRALPTPAVRQIAGPARRGWLAPLILLAAVLLAIPLVRGMRRSARVALQQTPTVPTQVEPRPETVPLALPNGRHVSVQRGSPAYQMASFLGGSAATPERFTLSPMNFDFGSTTLTPGSLQTVDDVAAILLAYPTSTIRIESYTDNVGATESNLALSLSRSEAVKSLLVSKGVDAARMSTAGLGAENPIASNATEEGRAQNRRTDIVVTGR
jgi:outer membrane protein OmpA-like peptidoglycan-associated protein